MTSPRNVLFPRKRHMAVILAGFAGTCGQIKARIDARLDRGDTPVGDLPPAIRQIGEMP